MRNRSWNSLALLIAVAATTMTHPAAAQQTESSPGKYFVFNLGAPGGISAAAASINNLGWIAGDNSTSATTEHAELWVGAPFDLGTLGGPNSAVAWPNKNTKGQIVGISETADVNELGEDWSCALANFPTITNHICYGFLWRDGAMRALLPLPGGLNSYGAAVNNRGQAVGWAENGTRDSTCLSPQVLQFEAVVWGPDPGQITELAPLPQDVDGAATAINDRGEVAGISGICDQAVGRYSAKHAVLWENGVAIDLGNFDGGVAWNTPTAINNRSQAVGFANLPNTSPGAFNPVGFFWSRETGIRKIPPVGTDRNNIAWGMNNHGQVVGDSCTDNTFAVCRAFVYEKGVTTDLNTLIQPSASLELVLANDIDDAGEIVGFGIDQQSNLVVAFLAVPVAAGGQGNRGEGGAAVLPNTVRPRVPMIGKFVGQTTVR
jgi:probable HAF family extracellular repeat protein